jgi:hypothetical protein
MNLNRTIKRVKDIWNELEYVQRRLLDIRTGF